jgi:hypothetical protein
MPAKTFNGSVPDQGVKRLLRHRESKAYFRQGNWTRNVEEADRFEDVVQVAEACVRYGLNNVELALRFESGNCDVFCTAIR